MDLKGVFAEVSIQMKSDFIKAQKSFSHSGLKGIANEETVKKFLRQYLPKSLDITSGILIDSDGNKSRQLDIIICDSAKTPIFYQNKESRVIPAECAYSVFEIKAFLSKTELGKAYENMQSVKALKKVAYFSGNTVIQEKHALYGKEWEHWPISYFIFAFDSPGLDSVRDNLNEYQGTNKIHKKIDSICVLDKGVILNMNKEGKLTALPLPESFQLEIPSSSALLLFYTTISVILNQAKMKPFNFQPYLKNMTLE